MAHVDRVALGGAVRSATEAVAEAEARTSTRLVALLRLAFSMMPLRGRESEIDRVSE
jgi:hypothetical protein